jgi:hypothetical protein
MGEGTAPATSRPAGLERHRSGQAVRRSWGSGVQARQDGRTAGFQNCRVSGPMRRGGPEILNS